MKPKALRYDVADAYRRLHRYKDSRSAFSWCPRGNLAIVASIRFLPQVH
jgi:hypothetical protein